MSHNLIFPYDIGDNSALQVYAYNSINPFPRLFPCNLFPEEHEGECIFLQCLSWIKAVMYHEADKHVVFLWMQV